jgi:hypothetical protein
MKRSARASVASILVLGAASFLACEDSSGSSSGATFDPDASTFNGPETAPPPPNDASIDNLTPPNEAGQDAAPADTATVVVTKDGAPDPGVSVVFQSSAGAALATVVTGADGKATSKVTTGDMITVALGAVNERQLLTYVGVKPGDVLPVVERTNRLVTITMATNNPGGGITIAAGNIDCSTNAASSGNPVSVTLLPECITGPVFPVIGNLRFNLNSYFSFKKDVAPAASGTTTVSGMTPWAIGTAYTMNVTNAPNLPGVQASLGQIANNQSSFPTASESNLVLAAGAGTAAFVVASGGYADAYQGDVQFVSYPAGYQQVLSFSKRFGAGTTQTLDMTAGVLPALTSTAVDNTAPARPVFSWTAASTLDATNGDSGVVTTVFTQPLAVTGSEQIEWTFIVPPGTLAVTAPELPASLVAFTPRAASTVPKPAVAFFESDLVSGYDFVRAHAGQFGLTRVPIGIFSGATIPALPAVGTLRITALAEGG